MAMGEPELRRTLAIDYSGQYLYDQNDTGTRPFTQRFALRGNYGFTKLNLGLGITYDGLAGENRDLGAQVNQDLLSIALTGTYELTPKTSVDLDVSLPIQRYSSGIDTSGITVNSFLNYQSTPKTVIGIGGAVGLEEVQGQDTQRFVQILVHSTVAPSPELAFSATAGEELREIGNFQKATPIFGVGAAWTPRLGTSFALAADRRTQVSSADASENYISTSVAFSATQRLGSWMKLQVSFGFEDARYYSISDTSSSSSSPASITLTGSDSNDIFTISSVGSTVAPDRHDQLYVGQIGIFAELSKRWSAQLQYSYTKNTSNTEAAFNDSRAQFQLNFNF